MLKAFGRRTPKKAPSRREMLALRPVHNPAIEWVHENGQVVLHIKRVQNWRTRILDLFFPLPGDRHVALDAIGTDVWLMMDGRTTMGSIVRALAEKYKLTARESELSLQQYVQQLSRRGYIGFLKADTASG